MTLASQLARSRRRFAHLIAATLTLAFVGLGGDSGQAGAFTTTKAMWGPAVHGGVSVFPTYRELGIKIYEDDLHWNLIALRRPQNARNPSDPAYVWPTEVTQAVAEAKLYGMRVALQIIGSPSWANGGKSWNWAPSSPQDYASFAIAAARRYPGVHLWMIWGEPTRSHNFEPLDPVKPFVTKLTVHQRSAPHRYAKLLDGAYGALKSVSRSNLVIGGMTFSGGEISTQQWIENLRLPNGKPARLDLYGHNPFIASEPNLSAPPTPGQSIGFSDLKRLAGLVDRYLGRPGNPHPKLFLSEWTIPTSPDQEFAYYTGLPLQAKWITAGLGIANGWSRIYATGWIHLYDEPPVTFGGLIESNGVKKPGFFAWQAG